MIHLQNPLCVFIYRHYSVAEVISMLEDDDFQTADILIVPPEDASKSDGDSGPEDDDGYIDNLSGNQLRAEAEATIKFSGFDRAHIGGGDSYDNKDGDVYAECDAEEASSTAVTQLVSKLPAGLSYRLYIDNFFTSPRLLDHLNTMQIFVTGTVRANRLEKCPLKPADELKKDCRGSYDHRLDTKSDMRAIRWNDNNVVSMLSNCFGIQPIIQVKRWSASEKKHVQIPMPYLVSQYNRFMGGTDRMDQNIEKLRINIRIKKWWWALFCFLIDVSVQNAWQLYRLSEAAQHQKMTLLDFRRGIALAYIMKYRNVNDIGRPVRKPTGVKCHKVPQEVRYDGQNHFIGRIDGGQKRCAQCGMKVQKMCSKCGVALHERCFKLFHTQ